VGEAIEMSAPRARPPAGFWIRALEMGHFIYDAAFDTTSRFAADKFFSLYVLHKILSIEKLFIIAGFFGDDRRRANLAELFRSRSQFVWF
jgi:hypothetical protein